MSEHSESLQLLLQRVQHLLPEPDDGEVEVGVAAAEAQADLTRPQGEEAEGATERQTEQSARDKSQLGSEVVLSPEDQRYVEVLQLLQHVRLEAGHQTSHHLLAAEPRLCQTKIERTCDDERTRWLEVARLLQY